MASIIPGIYMLNLTLLIVHEIDSAYWKEWQLFHLPGGRPVFLLLHLPLILLFLSGLPALTEGRFYGYVLSLVSGLSGLFAFVIHSVFLQRGYRQFNTLTSRGILTATLVVSAGQIFLTIEWFTKNIME